MSTIHEAAIAMSDLVTRLFISKEGELYTDILIEPDLPFRARYAGQEWETVNNDESGKPFVYSAERFDHAMRMFFSEDGVKPNVGWREIVKKSGGSAYPVIDMDVSEPVTATDVPSGDAAAPAPADHASRIYRVRMSVQQQNSGGYGAILRCLRNVPSSIDQLGLPRESIKQLLQQRSGLILVAGPTGAGKSTTIAAMVNHFNENYSANIISIEDPVEFIHPRKNSSIVAREVGRDCDSYADGVKQALRFVPDIIVIGEIRDAETMREAVRASESGHLVIATLHAPNAVGAVRKAYGYLSSEGDRIGLAGNLVGVIAQSLVLGKDRRKFMAYELLDCRSVLRDGKSVLTIQDAVSDAIQGAGDKPFQEFAEKFRDGAAGGPLSESFKTVLQRLVDRGDIDARRAASIPSDRTTQMHFLKMPAKA